MVLARWRLGASGEFGVPCIVPVVMTLEGLSNAEMEAEMSLLRLSVHEQTGNRIQLKAHVRANRTDRRLVPKPGTDVVAESLKIEAASIAETLPPSRNMTAPRLPHTFARSSVEKFRNEKPPIGSPPR